MWYVDFSDGTIEYWGVAGLDGSGSTDNFICVKGPAPAALSGGPPCQYVVQNGGTVLDKNTGLTWQQDLDGTKYSLSAAAAYCANNTPGLPGTGWRLPSMNELVSIVDYGQRAPRDRRDGLPERLLIGPGGILVRVPFAVVIAARGGSLDGGYAGSWLVDFTLGGTSVRRYWRAGPKGYVRCVR